MVALARARAICGRVNFPRHRTLVTVLTGVVIGSSCSVFPDTAVIPDHDRDRDREDSAAFAGEASGGSGQQAAGSAAVASQGGDAAETTAAAAGRVGVAPGAVVGAAPDAAAGAPSESLGGATGDPSCRNARTVRVAVQADAWLDAGARNARHGEETVLSITAGAAERRAIFALELPPAPAGTALQRAAFALYLQADVDTEAVKRRLELHLLNRPFVEALASWTRYDSGGKWQTQGGDFGPEAASAAVRTGAKREVVKFDVTEVVAQRSSLAWIILETPSGGSSSGALSFASREQGALDAPTLLLEYCEE